MSLRKTKTGRVDAKTIAVMLMSNVDRKPYTDTAYHNEELQPLTSKTDYSFHFLQTPIRAAKNRSAQPEIRLCAPV